MLSEAAMTRSEDGLSAARMKDTSLKSMSMDELWQLHELVVAELARKIAGERDRLEDRLRRLGAIDGEVKRERRPYPKVLPKYHNPKNRSETWAGRGKQPRWLTAQLRAGKRLSDFLIR
jgi:DNA-binding protein H-NS